VLRISDATLGSAYKVEKVRSIPESYYTLVTMYHFFGS
jgi:hypothetical protein